MKEIFKKINNERITDTEKQMMFSELEKFMSANPIKTPWYQKIENKIISPFNQNIFIHHKILSSAFVIVLLIGATGGTSMVAESSIPGDTLYPIKINLNEKFQSFKATTLEEQALIEASHIEERLSEAEKLSEQNKLDDTRKNQVESLFTQNLQNTLNKVKSIDESGDSKNAKNIKIKIEDSLKKHKTVVDKILETKKPATSQMKRAPAPEPEPAPETMQMMITTFSASDAEVATSTNKSNKERDWKENSRENNFEDKDTPILNETLRKIEEKED